MYALQEKEIKIESTRLHEVLLSIGIPPNLLGYSYILYAMELILLNPLYLHAITKRLYIDIGKKFDTSPASVERAMRTAISAAWTHGNIDYIDHVFRNCVNPVKGVPSNSLFLARLFYYFNSEEVE